MDNIKDLRDEFASIHTSANALLSLVTGEKREFTAEEKENQDKRFARMDGIKAQIDQSTRLAEMAFAKGEAQENKSRAEHEYQKTQPESKTNTVYDEVNRFMREGRDGSYQFTLITTSGSSAMLPKEVMAPYAVRRNVNAFRAAVAAQGYQPLVTSATDQISLPVWDDTSVTGQAPAEGATTNSAADSTVSGSITLNAVLFQGKTSWFSNTLLNANGFDILGYTAPVLQKRLDKAQETTWTTTAKALATGYTTAAPTAVSYADIIGWEHSLAVAYRSDGVFILSDTLYKAMRGLVDSNARPIIDLSPQSVFQETLHGKPIVVSDYFDALAATAKMGLFVSADAIKIRDVVPQRLTRYVNIPTFPDQTGYDLFANGDCQFVAGGASLLVSHA